MTKTIERKKETDDSNICMIINPVCIFFSSKLFFSFCSSRFLLIHLISFFSFRFFFFCLRIMAICYEKGSLLFPFHFVGFIVRIRSYAAFLFSSVCSARRRVEKHDESLRTENRDRLLNQPSITIACIFFFKKKRRDYACDGLLTLLKIKMI